MKTELLGLKFDYNWPGFAQSDQLSSEKSNSITILQSPTVYVNDSLAVQSLFHFLGRNVYLNIVSQEALDCSDDKTVISNHRFLSYMQIPATEGQGVERNARVKS